MSHSIASLTMQASGSCLDDMMVGLTGNFSQRIWDILPDFGKIDGEGTMLILLGILGGFAIGAVIGFLAAVLIHDRLNPKGE